MICTKHSTKWFQQFLHIIMFIIPGLLGMVVVNQNITSNGTCLGQHELRQTHLPASVTIWFSSGWLRHRSSLEQTRHPLDPCQPQVVEPISLPGEAPCSTYQEFGPMSSLASVRGRYFAVQSVATPRSKNIKELLLVLDLLMAYNMSHVTWQQIASTKWHVHTISHSVSG